MEPVAEWLRLAMLRGVGPVQGRRLVETVGDIAALWSASPARLREIEGVGEKLVSVLRQSRPEAALAVMQDCQRRGIRVLCPDDALWPDSLRAVDDAPLLLFVRGDAAALSHSRRLAVVGARRASREGCLVARRWSRYFSEHGVSVISGMAYGIDTEAHGGALEGVSPTVAVLGSGLACLNDQQQRQVDAISRQGCVISELLPNVAPQPEFFPRRNRIIAGLAQATLVVEADLRSGSLITARQAAGYGREVIAVPGSVLTGNHAGCHQLIRDGAALASTAAEVLEQMGWQVSGQGGRSYLPASDQEALLLRQIGRQGAHVDMLAESCGLTMSELSPILLRLELDGVIERLPGSRYLLAVELREA